jgi:hypothetical protein
MKSSLPLFAAFVAVFGIFASAEAEEKNGLSVNVSKTVIEKNDERPGYYTYQRINRTQGLKAQIKNVSFKEMPEGEIAWTILVKKYSSTSTESYSGTEKLKGMKPAEIQEVVFGNAAISGWNDGYTQSKDKMEWQIIIKQDGKEMLKSQSTSAFDSMAKHATKAVPERKAN